MSKLKQIFNKIQLLNEYNYYSPKSKNILGEEDEELTDGNTDELDNDDLEQDNSESTDDENSLDDLEQEAGLEDEELTDDDMDMPQGDDTGEDLGGEDEIEVDVSDIVDQQEALGGTIENVNQKLDDTINRLDDFADKIVDMSNNVINKLSSMEKEFKSEMIKRAPTPNEQLMMRSMSSYPYNTKLSDYWKPAPNGEDEYSNTITNPEESKYNMKSGKAKEPETFTLKQKDIDNDFSSLDIKNSFG